MPSPGTYHLIWVSFTLDSGFLLTAAAPDLGHGGISSWPPLLRLLILFLSEGLFSVAIIVPLAYLILREKINQGKENGTRVQKVGGD